MYLRPESGDKEPLYLAQLRSMLLDSEKQLAMPKPFAALVPEEEIRRKLIHDLSCLSGDNFIFAEKIYKALMADVLQSDPIRSLYLVEAEDDPACKRNSACFPPRFICPQDLPAFEDCLIIYTLALHHPAFSFEQQQRLFSRLLDMKAWLYASAFRISPLSPLHNHVRREHCSRRSESCNQPVRNYIRKKERKRASISLTNWPRSRYDEGPKPLMKVSTPVYYKRQPKPVSSNMSSHSEKGCASNRSVPRISLGRSFCEPLRRHSSASSHLSTPPSEDFSAANCYASDTSLRHNHGIRRGRSPTRKSFIPTSTLFVNAIPRPHFPVNPLPWTIVSTPNPCSFAFISIR
ncbi:hypothetical protein Ciccas_004127 [Cichlidogyrus casuarinus]|uniref:SMAUG/ZCCHC2-like PHAT domain-containing protein n=1 Tax=Cichlidogyrus casuarinus TaxID=1844966 RepID=A0ABD2QFR7_9PLAT